MFQKFRQLIENREALLATGVNPFGVVVEHALSATEAVIGGRPTILAGTNNYLGLTFDPECIRAAQEAVSLEGTGTTGSRMANGTFSGHLALEREIAEFFGKRICIVFSTGFQANIGMLSALAGPGDVVLIDADCHASIYDGCRLCGAEILRFRHNDTADLEKRLRRLGDRARKTVVVVEGIYSMLGDRAPLAEVTAVKKRYGAYLMVDEAHSLGVLGEKGRGLIEEARTEEDADFVVGTFSKSLGAIGGYCVSDHAELEAIRYASRPYIFTASPSPSVIASTRTALRLLRERPELREALWRNARTLYAGLQKLGLSLGPEPSPIVAVRLETKEEVLGLWKGLLDRGVYVNLVLPPAVPGGGALLRCSMSAAHTPEQVARILGAFASVLGAAAPA